MKAYSTGYFLLRELVRIPYHLFYRKISVVGTENIPRDKPLIFAPNHQNALMDPLAMIFSTPKQIVFLARGDIFKTPLLIKILNFLKILPVYRQHDGKAALKKNNAVFDESVDYLEQQGAFCLFPESIHNPHRNLRPLKKGIPRIAFMALRKTDFNLDIQIIPTGIYYQDKDNSHSYLQIKYGKAIPVSDYINQIQENEQKAMAALSVDMAPKIKPLIIDIEENEDYDLIENIRAFFSDKLMQQFKLKISDENRFKMDQALIKHLKEHPIKQTLKDEIKDLISKIETYKRPIESLLSQKSIGYYLWKIILFIMFFPIAVLGGIINLLPFALSKYLRTKLIKDPQFTSSIKFVVGGIIMPIYFLILSLLSLIFIPFYGAIMVLFIVPITSFFGYYYFKKLSLFYNLVSYNLSQQKSELEPLKSTLFKKLNQLFVEFKYSA